MSGELVGHTREPVNPEADDPAISGPSILASLVSEVEKEVGSEEATFPVPGRPGYAVRYDTAISLEEVDHWRRGALRGKKSGDADPVLLAAIELASKSVAIIRNGEEVVDDDGDVVTFRSKSLLDALDVTKAADAVLKLYGRDIHVTQTANALLRRAGFGDTVEEIEDPTTG